VRNFWRRQWAWLGSRSSSVVSGAVAWSMSASKAIVRPMFLAFLLAVLVPGSVILFTSKLRASSNIITVNNVTDPAGTSGNGFCTLREAINNSNSPGVDTTGGDCAAGTGNDIINFSVSGTITLNSALPPIANSVVTIDGTGQTVTVDGAKTFQVFTVSSTATVTLNDLTIAHGNSGNEGGGIFSKHRGRCSCCRRDRA
jgi:hypothetical protein